MDKTKEEITLLLMYLSSWDEKGYLYPERHKNKSVILTQEGEKLARKLIDKYVK